MPAAGGAPRLPEPVGVLPSGRVLLVEYEDGEDEMRRQPQLRKRAAGQA